MSFGCLAERELKMSPDFLFSALQALAVVGALLGAREARGEPASEVLLSMGAGFVLAPFVGIVLMNIVFWGFALVCAVL